MGSIYEQARQTLSGGMARLEHGRRFQLTTQFSGCGMVKLGALNRVNGRTSTTGDSIGSARRLTGARTGDGLTVVTGDGRLTSG
jgi:hypothetical protein